jgi:broad specificity phosphatase PhoE
VPSRLTLISHAPTEALRTASFPLDEPLTDQALEKLSALHWTPPRAQQVLCAPEARARQTAQALGLSAQPTPALRDCDYGAWNGFTFSDIASLKAEEVTHWLSDPSAAPHGGESISQLMERVGHWLEGRRGQNDTVAVTHPAVIRAAIVNALGAPAQAFWRIDIAPLSLTDMRWNGANWTLRSSGVGLQPLQQ